MSHSDRNDFNGKHQFDKKDFLFLNFGLLFVKRNWIIQQLINFYKEFVFKIYIAAEYPLMDNASESLLQGMADF